jgi:hypothetical protein
LADQAHDDFIQEAQSSINPPSSIQSGERRDVEKKIFRCCEHSTRRRPEAADLPGGNELIETSEMIAPGALCCVCALGAAPARAQSPAIKMRRVQDGAMSQSRRTSGSGEPRPTIKMRRASLFRLTDFSNQFSVSN